MSHTEYISVSLHFKWYEKEIQFNFPTITNVSNLMYIKVNELYKITKLHSESRSTHLRFCPFLCLVSFFSTLLYPEIL